MTTICISSTCLPCDLKLGGHVWVYLNWARGCVLSGCDVILLEAIQHSLQPAEVLGRVRSFKKVLNDTNVPAGICVVWPTEEQSCLAQMDSELGSELERETVSIDHVVQVTDLFLNSVYAMPADIIKRFRKSALLDIDPGLLQVWLYEEQIEVAPHDSYFTIGETVGRSGAKFPSCGLPWVHTPPPVDLKSWPGVPVSDDAPYTTVTNWWGEWVQQGNDMYNNEKRTSFNEYRDLPNYTKSTLELAVFNADEMGEERAEFELQGWQIRDSGEVSHSPFAFRNYIQESRGEFSCAKPSCMKLENAWISDRTICYLASGKPAIVQHTGESRYLPDNEGLFRFRTLQEGVKALMTIEENYDAHARMAQSLAEEHFDAQRVVKRVLELAM